MIGVRVGDEDGQKRLSDRLDFAAKRFALALRQCRVNGHDSSCRLNQIGVNEDSAFATNMYMN